MFFFKLEQEKKEKTNFKKDFSLCKLKMLKSQAVNKYKTGVQYDCFCSSSVFSPNIVSSLVFVWVKRNVKSVGVIKLQPTPFWSIICVLPIELNYQLSAFIYLFNILFYVVLKKKPCV